MASLLRFRKSGIPISFQVGPENVAKSIRVFQRPPKRAFDKNFEIETETYEGEATFLGVASLPENAPADYVVHHHLLQMTAADLAALIWSVSMQHGCRVLHSCFQ
ncbi:MAG: hypothetical protein NTW28_02845 [Candidatus Solibacter sp.]|nr:hypothetical protein [Candidatus Solibacter sp.]